MATTPLRWRFTQLVRLLMLTGCRVGEICHGRWEWVDEKAAVMVIPADDHKTGQQTGKERVVHIPPAAVLILRELRLKSNSEWIIAGQGDSHLVGYQKLWSELMTLAKIRDFTVHSLRPDPRAGRQLARSCQPSDHQPLRPPDRRGRCRHGQERRRSARAVVVVVPGRGLVGRLELIGEQRLHLPVDDHLVQRHVGHHFLQVGC